MANEENLNYYELQRSTDGQNFSNISKINATGKSEYNYSDYLNNTPSLYYYRLMSVDKDANFKYSLVITITTASQGKFAQVNPNPFQNKLLVSIQSAFQDKAIVTLTDMSGRQLLRQTRTLASGTNEFEINEAENFYQGTYILTVRSSQHVQSIKVVKGD